MKRFRRRPALGLGLATAGVLVLALLAIYLVLTVVMESPTGSPNPGPGEDQQLAASQEPAGGQHFAADDAAAPKPPKENTLNLTVPKLARVDRVPVKTGGITDTQALRQGALRVEGTGLPWQRGANTYIAGHRLGFPGTKSHLLFWDLDKLVRDDRIFLKDANGTVYEYTVFHKEVVGPDAVRVADPVAGKSIVTLQTCTLPDYSERLVVQAELVGDPVGDSG